ncbi:MAG: hypothetical protein NT022_11560 [Deltaproteobacteria bacterium]|nr:hypothetical protein [Deltaproteobacteria bacterium]
MDTEEDKRFIKGIKEAIAKSRGYADSFGWPPNRDLEEYGVVRSFCEALEKEGESFLDSNRIISRGCGNDPPDCEVQNLDGNLVGIEVTELVDPDAIVAYKKNQVYEWAEWDKAKLIDAINDRLDAKDTHDQIKGGPYADYILIIYTDEPILNPDYVKELLTGHCFAMRNLIDRTFLLIFYDPIYRTYPCIELEFGT